MRRASKERSVKFETVQQVSDHLERIALAVETAKKYGTQPVLDAGQLREMAAFMRASAPPLKILRRAAGRR